MHTCLICATPTRAVHYGIESCRACACFFKRSFRSGKRFVCRKGDGNCVIRKDEHDVCKGCRFDACARLGMAEGLKNPRKENNALADVPLFQAKEHSCLSAVMSAYAESVSRRMKQEMVIVQRHHLKDAHRPSKDYYIINSAAYQELFRLVIIEARVVFESVFKEFRDLSYDIQRELFRGFFSKFYMLESLYLHSLHFKGTAFNVCSYITCMDNGNLEDWFTDEVEYVKRDELKDLLHQYALYYADVYMPVRKIDDLTETEHIALIVLTFCDDEVSTDQPERVRAITETWRRKTFAELQNYYREELGLIDSSKRMTDLMTIAQLTNEASLIFTEEYRMCAAMFDLWTDDEVIREVFLTP